MRKIMFNDKYELTDAVLNGTKTQTRRVIKTNDAFERLHTDNWSKEQIREWNSNFTRRVENMNESDKAEMFNYLINNPKYKVGEIVAVAMSYKDAGIDPYYKIYNERTKEYDNACDTAGWDNKMFVKADLMPHQIKITNVRIERLQDISDEYCIAEGVQCFARCYYVEGLRTSRKYAKCAISSFRHGEQVFSTPREAFSSLIDRISGKGTWDSNPYVFAYEFELVK